MADERALEAARQAWLESASDYTRLDDSIRAAITAYLASVEADGWLDIASAPKDGTAVLLFAPGHGRWIGRYKKRSPEWRLVGDPHLNDGGTPVRPTHWHPLPAPPRAMLSAAGGTDE